MSRTRHRRNGSRSEEAWNQQLLQAISGWCWLRLTHICSSPARTRAVMPHQNSRFEVFVNLHLKQACWQPQPGGSRISIDFSRIHLGLPSGPCQRVWRKTVLVATCLDPKSSTICLHFSSPCLRMEQDQLSNPDSLFCPQTHIFPSTVWAPDSWCQPYPHTMKNIIQSFLLSNSLCFQYPSPWTNPLDWSWDGMKAVSSSNPDSWIP